MRTEKPQVVQREAVTFGDILRRERQLRGLTIHEASMTTKLAVKYLEALEANDFDVLPGGVYNKGFLRTYATFIGLDPEEMVNHYLFELSSTHQEPEIEPVPQNRGAASRGLVLAFLGTVALAALAVLVWWFMRGGATS